MDVVTADGRLGGMLLKVQPRQNKYLFCNYFFFFPAAFYFQNLAIIIVGLDYHVGKLRQGG